MGWSEGSSLSPSCPNWRKAEGILPKPLPRFYLFSRQGTATQYFTFHKVVFPARIALAASSFAGKRSRSAELRESGGG